MRDIDNQFIPADIRSEWVQLAKDNIMDNETTQQDRANALFDRLREEGRHNMFGVAPFAEQAFGVSQRQARGLLAEWMETFEQRHPQ
jgi:hypothetical protein